MPQFSGTKDIRGYLRILWRWKYVLLAFVIAAPAAAYLIERGKPNIYKSSTLVSEGQVAVPTSSGTSYQPVNATAVAQLVTIRPVAQIAARLMNPPADPAQILGEVSASGNTTTNFVTITATDRSPTRAAEIANAFAQALTSHERSSANKQLNQQIAGIKVQLSRLGSGSRNSATQASATRAQLVSQLSTLQAQKSTQNGVASVLESAVPSSSPTNTPLRRTVELGLLIGLLLGLGAVALAENADRRLRSPDDLEHMADVPLLASIPPSAFSRKIDTGPVDEEAFQMLRTALLYFDSNRQNQSVVITSAGEQEGKTTVAVRLALASARAGLRVILLDGDLRRADVGPRLKIDASEGLTAVLTGARSLDEVLVSYPVDDPGAGQLLVVPAGSSPTNPAALISSPEMARVLQRLESDSDLVVIDTPAALMVSDPLPLIELASGVVMVARMNNSTRDKVRRLRKIVRAVHGNLFGVVATGVRAGSGYGYYASSYYYKRARKAKVAATNGRPSEQEARKVSAEALDRTAEEHGDQTTTSGHESPPDPTAL